MRIDELPVGSAPAAAPLPHFPDALHALLWRSWGCVPLDCLARVLGVGEAKIAARMEAMGLPPPPPVTPDQRRRNHLCIIRRCWHLLPYAQLLALLDWTPQQLAYVLQEDDFLWVKLGRLKPDCPPVRWSEPDAPTASRLAAMRKTAAEELGGLLAPATGSRHVERPFDFVDLLSRPPVDTGGRGEPEPGRDLAPRYLYSYFAPYGDPLLVGGSDPYPEGYLARLAACGVDGIWLQGILYTLAPFPWEPARSDMWGGRLAALNRLVERAGRHGLGVFLYLNEPRSMPLEFFDARPELRGVTEEDHATLCTSAPAVRDWLVAAVETVCREVPGLRGIFTITASENLTHCWSHHRGHECPRCAADRDGVTAGVNGAIREGMRRAGSQAMLIAWDWGWPDDAAPGIIARLPEDAAHMSVSEWDLPLNRGGVPARVGEYCLSAVGPGPRARRHWALARRRGLRTLAKIQANITWELAAVPYLPAVAHVAEQIERLRDEGVSGLMLGWTLGGCPSPNLEVIEAMSRRGGPDADAAMLAVAGRRCGEAAPRLVAFWKAFSRAFAEFPYHGQVVYHAPLQAGPANLLWPAPTGYRSTMVGFGYDDLDGWRAVYPAPIFIDQLRRVAGGIRSAVEELTSAVPNGGEAVEEDVRMARAAEVHFRSVANQAEFILLRDRIAARDEDLPALRAAVGCLLSEEMELARTLLRLQQEDSRLGFEASNHYFYLAQDLAEKVLNCRFLLDEWLPGAGSR